jgi:hypothetical protein
VDSSKKCNCPMCSGQIPPLPVLNMVRELFDFPPITEAQAHEVVARAAAPATPSHRPHPEGEPDPAPTVDATMAFTPLTGRAISLTPEHLQALKSSHGDTVFAVYRLGGYSATQIIPVLQDFEDAGITTGAINCHVVGGRAVIMATLSPAAIALRNGLELKGWAV